MTCHSSFGSRETNPTSGELHRAFYPHWRFLIAKFKRRARAQECSDHRDTPSHPTKRLTFLEATLYLVWTSSELASISIIFKAMIVAHNTNNAFYLGFESASSPVRDIRCRSMQGMQRGACAIANASQVFNLNLNLI